MESSENDPALEQFLTCKCERAPLRQTSEKPESWGKVLLKCEKCNYQEWEADAIKRLQRLGVIDAGSGKDNNVQDEIEFWKSPNSIRHGGIGIFQNAGDDVIISRLRASNETPTNQISVFEKSPSPTTPSPATVTSDSNNDATPVNNDRTLTPKHREISTNELIAIISDHMHRQDRRLFASQKEIRYLRRTSEHHIQDLQNEMTLTRSLQEENKYLESQIHSATQVEFESLKNNVKFLTSQNSAYHLEIKKLRLDNEAKDRDIALLTKRIQSLEKVNTLAGSNMNVEESVKSKNRDRPSDTRAFEMNSSKYTGNTGLNNKRNSFGSPTSSDGLLIESYEKKIRDLKCRISELVSQNNLLANLNVKLRDQHNNTTGKEEAKRDGMTIDDLYKRNKHLEQELVNSWNKMKEVTLRVDGISSMNEELEVTKRKKIIHDFSFD
ncbi:4118_t:CDS:2 [Acaulospora colombiana]|uniref:4118_t:CDS:1 n=1 Tax=Acaulospora colombiana TaxID=27376 RepID=A0ACA9KCP0_9GLOM|nr:4118_t:CDS:2 [Acaulospora colombiana]